MEHPEGDLNHKQRWQARRPQFNEKSRSFHSFIPLDLKDYNAVIFITSPIEFDVNCDTDRTWFSIATYFLKFFLKKFYSVIFWLVLHYTPCTHPLSVPPPQLVNRPS